MLTGPRLTALRKSSTLRPTLNALAWAWLFIALPGGALAFQEGTAVPRTTLSTGRGKKIEITGYAKAQGKRNLLLVFFRTGNCGLCVSQLIEFSQRHREILEANAEILAVSVDDAIIQAQTSEKIESRYPILLDPDAKTTKAFGVFNPQERLAFPATFVVGPDRRVLYRYVGKDLHDRPPFDRVMEVLRHYSGLAPTAQPNRQIARDAAPQPKR